MSTNNSLHGFIPFIRRGLANNINVASTNIGRAKLDVVVKFDSSNLAQQTIELYSPGDIESISPNMIVRTEPAENVFDFDANYLPFIEFFEEDFLWRYSPTNPVAGSNKLKPWLVLIVLKDDEFEIEPPTENRRNAILKIKSTVVVSDVIHPSGDHWAFGHVQVNQLKPKTSATVPSIADYIADTKANLESNPDTGICRLLATRKLLPKTQYTAFLVPAFEAGRLAGIGETFLNALTIKPSWDNGTPGLKPEQFPIYHQWRFGTAALGDFETLARALTPRKVAKETGTMDTNC
jgi:hypothetical protein